MTFITECLYFYVPASLTCIAAGIQRFLQNECNRRDFWLLKKEDSKFKLFRDALDCRRKRIFSAGIGVQPRQADPVTPDDERRLWDSGVFSTETSVGLSYIVYFYNCKVFGFRARDEHCNLTVDQYKILTIGGRKCLQYSGRLAKNVTGSFESRATPRVVRQFADPSNPRCIVSIFEKYLSLVPQSGRFYRRPLPSRNQPHYSAQHVGVNKLSDYMTEMYKAAKIDVQGRHITGHSGKVTCCTTLYAQDFDEQAIKSRSGHRSDAVRLYKRPSSDLCQRISDSLQPPKPDTPDSTVSDDSSDSSSVSSSSSSSSSSSGGETVSPVKSVPTATASHVLCAGSRDDAVPSATVSPTRPAGRQLCSVSPATGLLVSQSRPDGLCMPPIVNRHDVYEDPVSSSTTQQSGLGTRVLDPAVVPGALCQPPIGQRPCADDPVSSTVEDCVGSSQLGDAIGKFLASQRAESSIKRNSSVLEIEVPSDIRKVIILQNGIRLSLQL